MIHPAQHGFRSGHSTTTNLVSYVEKVLDGMTTHGQVDAIYTDFSKAFDRLDHSFLVQKLREVGVSRSFLNWIESYLNDRIMRVRLSATPTVLSGDFLTPSDVPQGSHLGPLFFALFVNDLCSKVKHCVFLLYADDLKIFKPIASIDNCVELQQDLQSVEEWCVTNGMPLNLSKCEVVSFSRKSTENHLS